MFVNTNGYMEGGDGGESGQDEKGHAIQKAIVAAWLLVKESAALISKLVIISPPPPSSDLSGNGKVALRNEKEDHALLGEEDVTLLGGTLLNALGRLRHMGAISETSAALQNICECLLR